MINSNRCKQLKLNKSNLISKYFNTLRTKLRATHTPSRTSTNHTSHNTPTTPYLSPYIYSNNFNFSTFLVINQFIKLNNTINNKITTLKLVKLFQEKPYALYFNLKTSK